MKIGDKVKYYFKESNGLVSQIGTIVDIYSSTIYFNKLHYIVKRIDRNFIDGGYREEFTRLEDN